MNEPTITSRSQTHLLNKLIYLAGYGYIALFIVLILLKSFIPQGSGGWSNPPIYDYIIWFGLGSCISIMGFGYSFFAWTKNAQEYVEWLLAQSGRKIQWHIELLSNSPVFSLWLARLIAPFITLFGFWLIGYISFLIDLFIFGQ